jgi:hypothetical protein
MRARVRVRGSAAVAAALAVGLAAAGARADDTPAATALLRSLPAGELVMFDSPRKDRSPRLLLLARVKAPPERLRVLLADPQAYRRAIPSFVRADTLESKAGPAGTPPSRRLAWELEIPLWNLEGELWMRPLSDGVALDLVAGDLAPGRFVLRALPDGVGGGQSVLMVDGGAPVKNANWMTRRLAARDPRAEPAMAVTAAFVLLRALALQAERPGSRTAAASPRWPQAPMSAPTAEHLDGQALGAALAAGGFPLGPGSAAALVRSRSDGRLGQVALALQVALPQSVINNQLAQPSRWTALAGWKEIEVQPAPETPQLARWEVDSSLPFVDFDATWLVRAAAPFRAAIDRGDWRGAVMGWDVLPATPSVAVFSLHPRVETTGYLPRKLIEAEPLLEHGLALGLAYVDALALAAALQPPPR